ncbi:hypothetical protein GCM10007147_45910 [Nocardiopsis kunsanensis]|uniref:Uncharacterized protein n=1 Tax=Nocardiopsis kunsanensis TaxID=141693 RepID=A0A918XMT4_9ACTN|nr:hypothetical protein GCM10007147_45910 [Nocardiopsis kunsanensis]
MLYIQFAQFMEVTPMSHLLFIFRPQGKMAFGLILAFQMNMNLSRFMVCRV